MSCANRSSAELTYGPSVFLAGETFHRGSQSNTESRDRLTLIHQVFPRDKVHYRDYLGLW